LRVPQSVARVKSILNFNDGGYEFSLLSWAERGLSPDSGFSSSTLRDSEGLSKTSSSRIHSTSPVTAILPIACTGSVV
jgi:hypothetical protein